MDKYNSNKYNSYTNNITKINKINKINTKYNSFDNQYDIKSSTVIILDWDDTLFPTSWVVNNNINLTDSLNRWKYLSIFNKLDNILCALIKKLQKYGQVIIITNALLNWIKDSVSVLPKTSEVIKYIKILSARQLFQTQSNDIMEWKKRTFKQIINNKINNKKILNIISIGDAEYEYRALIDLYNYDKSKKKILKSIRLIHNPNKNILIDQLMVLYNIIPNICSYNNHIDWNFKIN